MAKLQFQWIDNSEKDITSNTKTLYKRKLNALAKQGYMNRDDLLNNATAINSFIETNKSRQMRNLYYASVFYCIGRQDFATDSRALPLFQGFQKNYQTKSTADEGNNTTE